MRTFVLASHNPGKIKEFEALFQGSPFRLMPQSVFKVKSIEETGLTFVENALLKARHVAHYTDLPIIADDSGLAVDVLDGRPGVRSARYGGAGQSDKDRCILLLEEMKNINANRRTARYHSVIVFLKSPTDPSPLIFQGSWPGKILTKMRGEGGFGYDPIFYVESLGCTAAELSLAQKNALSHRSQAMAKLFNALMNVPGK